MANIMAIDAGFSHSGVVIIDLTTKKIIHACCIDTEKDSTKRKVRASDDLADRSATIFRHFTEIKDKFNPKAIVVELPSGGSKSLIAGRAMGMALAVVSCFVEANKLPGVYITPAEGKKALGGQRNASKQDIQIAALKIHPELEILVPTNKNGRKPAWFEHVCDAVAAWVAAGNDPIIRAVKTP